MSPGITAPILALGNAGTPLMWVGFLHLVGGNFIIAGVEALIAWRFWGVRWLRAFAILLLANYASMLVGAAAGSGGVGWLLHALRGEAYFQWLPWIVTGAYVGCLGITLAVEYWFCLWALAAGPGDGGARE